MSQSSVSEHVFAGRDGESLVEIRGSLSAAAERAGIAKIGMYQLRHAFCSHALMAGVDPRTVQQWLGHKDLRTTLRYAHTLPSHEQAAIQRLKCRNEPEAERGAL